MPKKSRPKVIQNEAEAETKIHKELAKEKMRASIS